MQWSITLGKIGGIAVRLHVTFLLLLVWIGVSHYLAGGAVAAISGLAFIGAIFGSVLLHEFGHAFAARRYGVRTPDITLLPIGGVARLERIPDELRAELVVAIAGPLVNIVIAGGLYLLMQAPVPTASQSEMLVGAFQRMVSGGFTAVPVVNNDQKLVGLLTRDNVAEVMMVQGALPRRQPQWA